MTKTADADRRPLSSRCPARTQRARSGQARVANQMVGAEVTPASCIAALSSGLPAKARAASNESKSCVTVTSFASSAAWSTALPVTPTPGDRRGVRVVLTDDGRHRYTAAVARHREVIEREFGQRLRPDQHRAVADALWLWWHAGGTGPTPDRS